MNVMTRTQINKAFAKYGLFFVASVFLGWFVALTLGVFAVSSLQFIPQLFAPKNSGLDDHIMYAGTVGALLGVVGYGLYLGYLALKKRMSTTMPWLVAAFVEMVLLLTSLINRSISQTPYMLSDYALTWLQVIVLVPVVGSYLWFMSRSSK